MGNSKKEVSERVMFWRFLIKVQFFISPGLIALKQSNDV